MLDATQFFHKENMHLQALLCNVRSNVIKKITKKKKRAQIVHWRARNSMSLTFNT